LQEMCSFAIKTLQNCNCKKECKMQPHSAADSSQNDLFRSRLEQIINMQHELVTLAEAIDWKHLEKTNASYYAQEGRPGVNTRLIVGLHILKQMYNLSDESVCDRWVCDPYFQYFCGEVYFQHTFPMERSSMTHWRKRVGEKFCETLVQESLRAAHQLGALHGKDLTKVVADTTVQPKAITFPTDAKLTIRH
jgi:transposase, IS5 family